jgi:hypothetical protein
MTVADVTGLITALTALAIAVGGVITALKVLREVKVGNELTQTGNELTQTGNAMTGKVHQQLNSQKHAADKYQQDLRTALQTAGVTIPDDVSLEEGNAVREEEKR